MLCLHPILVRKYAELADGSHKKVNQFREVPCGKCAACLSRRRNEWTYRLTAEQRTSDYSFFVTLTYDDQNIPIKVSDCVPYFVFRKSDVQKYLKRVRYFLSEISDCTCTYYLVSEYGGHTHRPHYRMLFYIQNDPDLKCYKNVSEILRQTWCLGFSVVKPTSAANIHYVTKYCVKSLDQAYSDTLEDTFVMCSKKRYLGSREEDKIFSQNNYGDIDRTGVFLNGYAQPVPRIYRDKLNFPSFRSAASPHLRLSVDKYYKWKNEYIKLFKKFDQKNFLLWCDKRLSYLEDKAIQTLTEKLDKL